MVVRCAYHRVDGVLQDRAPGEVDLHGLYVEEAIRYSKDAIITACLRGDTKINFIVGTLQFSLEVGRILIATQARVCIRQTVSLRSDLRSRS